MSNKPAKKSDKESFWGAPGADVSVAVPGKPTTGIYWYGVRNAERVRHAYAFEVGDTPAMLRMLATHVQNVCNENPDDTELAAMRDEVFKLAHQLRELEKRRKTKDAIIVAVQLGLLVQQFLDVSHIEDSIKAKTTRRNAGRAGPGGIEATKARQGDWLRRYDVYRGNGLGHMKACGAVVRDLEAEGGSSIPNQAHIARLARRRDSDSGAAR